MPDIVVMFFLLGLVAGAVKSDLQVPKATYDTLSLLLMLTIGLKGGMALHGNIHWGLMPELTGVALLSAFIPLMLMPVLRRWVRLSAADSASIAAHYGSVSAGTFAVALAYVEARQLAVGSEVTLYLVAMELPAIMVAIALFRRYQGAAVKESTSKLWHETLTNRGVILLVSGWGRDWHAIRAISRRGSHRIVYWGFQRRAGVVPARNGVNCRANAAPNAVASLALSDLCTGHTIAAVTAGDSGRYASWFASGLCGDSCRIGC